MENNNHENSYLENSQLDTKKNEDFYKKIRKKIIDYLETEKGQKYKYGRYLLLAPDFFYLLCKLAFDKNVPTKSKALLFSTIAYYISPLDLLPEFIVGPLGFIDDVALGAFVLKKIINDTSPETVEKYWLGKRNVLQVIQEVLKVADEMLGSGLWNKIKKLFNK